MKDFDPWHGSPEDQIHEPGELHHTHHSRNYHLPGAPQQEGENPGEGQWWGQKVQAASIALLEGDSSQSRAPQSHERRASSHGQEISPWRS